MKLAQSPKMSALHNTQVIKDEALRLGFSHCGISKAGFLEEEAPLLELWLKEGKHGNMRYMERNFDKRLDPTKLVPGAKSVISLLLNYFPDQNQQTDAPRISKYAYGTDYHLVIKDKLYSLVNHIKEHVGDVNGRVFVDSAPVLDKAWAKRSGLGWVGKNANLINKEVGSFFFIAELICDLELEYDKPVADFCGTCTKCIDACPTDAIVDPYVVDGSKCISYFTIELRDEIPLDMKGKFEGWAFGCDICQDVCPWNRFSTPHKEPQFNHDNEMLNMSEREWDEITEEVFNAKFKDSPLSRAGYDGMKRNLGFIKKAAE